MYEIAILVAGVLAFGLIAYRTTRMAIRARRRMAKKRLHNHLDWSMNGMRRPPRV